MRIMETRVFTFAELSDESRERAITDNRGINIVDDSWYEYVIDDIKDIAKMLGFDVDNVYFSGFHSQGDGCCITGSYGYRKGSLKAIKSHTPNEKELHEIVLSLQETQRRYFYGVGAKIVHRGRYYHELSNDIDVYCETYQEIDSRHYVRVMSLLRQFMQWAYSKLESEYEYLTSDSAVAEALESYEFTKNGETI